MPHPIRFICSGLVFACLLLPYRAFGADDVSRVHKRILFFSKSSGYEHSVIKDPSKPFVAVAGSSIPGLAMEVLRSLGERSNIEVVCSKDGSLFTAKYLDQFDAYCFFTTGDLTEHGLDGNPPMTLEGKAALLTAVENGRGFVGLHSATDTFHSPQGDEEILPARYRDNGENVDPYVRMIGGEFITHGTQQPSRLLVIDPKFPGIGAVPSGVRLLEEWYSLKNFAPNLHVLLVQDTSDMTGAPYARPSYPSTWARLQGKGRVFYTNLGHRDDIWENAMFQTMLIGALNWTTGRIDADVTPNLNQAAPQARVLPKFVAPPVRKPEPQSK